MSLPRLDVEEKWLDHSDTSFLFCFLPVYLVDGVIDSRKTSPAAWLTLRCSSIHLYSKNSQKNLLLEKDKLVEV
jgi:hypothetical protein